MTKGVVIALAISILVVGGLAFFVNSSKANAAKNKPPLYSGYGPGALNPNGPPVGKAGVTSTLQDVTNVINGGDKVFNAGKKLWDDVSGLFGNDPDDIDLSYVDSLPK